MDTGLQKTEFRRSFNPLTLSHDYKVLKSDGLKSPNQIISENDLIFIRPVILLVDGKPVMRAEWDSPVKVGSVAHFVELPQGGNALKIVATIAIAIAAAYTGGLAGGLAGGAGWSAAAVSAVKVGVGATVFVAGTETVNHFMDNTKAATLKTQAEAKPSYSLTSGGNALNLGNPYVEQFGRFICFPDLVMAPYIEIPHVGENASQWLHILGIIGVGEYEIEGVYLDKTPMVATESGSWYANDLEYRIIPPGESPSLITRTVWTNATVSGQELTETQDEFSIVINPAGTTIYTIGYDFIFPYGLHSYTSKGNLADWSVIVHFQVRKVDDYGNPIGDWRTKASDTFLDSTVEALRYSRTFYVFEDPGRYEARMWISYPPGQATDARKSDRVLWAGLRGYNASPWGEITPITDSKITMIECAIKATNEINGSVATKMNVIATRKLNTVTETGLSAEKTATRSVVDACAYMVTCENGGRQPESVLDIESLYTLKGILDAKEWWFDWRFASKLTVMDACAIAAKCGRSVPAMPGGKFTLVYDDVKTPSQSYTWDDYTEGAFEINHFIKTDDSPDGIEIRYIDSVNWQTKSYTYPEEGVQNPSIVQLDGCTNEDQAKEIAYYLYMDNLLQRSTITFTTGLKGHIPMLGDWINVSSKMSDITDPEPYNDDFVCRITKIIPRGSNEVQIVSTFTDESVYNRPGPGPKGCG